MKVCVFGGTNPATNPKYYDVACEMGKLLVECDLEKVWGGNAHGVLAQIHKHYVENNAPNTLVIPEVYQDDLQTMTTDKVVTAETIAERTRGLIAPADAIIVMPGGIGTIYEFWAAVEYRRAEEFDYEIILLNYDNFFQHQLAHYDFINKNGFTKIGKGGAPYKICPTDLFMVASTPKEVIAELTKLRKRLKK